MQRRPPSASPPSDGDSALGSPEPSDGPTSEQAASRRGHAPRRTKEELRTLVLEAGRDMLLEEGLGTGAERVTFKRVFHRLAETQGVRLTNASVIGRIWTSQAQFQAEVLASIARDDFAQDLMPVVSTIEEVLMHLDRTSLASRRSTLQQLCRVGGAAAQQALLDSQIWSSWIRIWSYALHRWNCSNDEGNAERTSNLPEAILGGYQLVTRDYGDLHRALAAVLGFRCREDLTFDQLTIAGSALAEGCALRDRIDPGMARNIPRPTGPNGELEEWTLLGIGLEALVNEFFEPDPSWSPGRPDP